MADASQNDVSMLDAPVLTATSQNQKPAKKAQIITERTIKTPAFSYINLSLQSSSPTPPPVLDDLSVRSYLSTALNHLLGLTGSAISIDIMMVEDKECWIRVPREDLAAVLAATGQWQADFGAPNRMAWHLKASGNFLGSVAGVEAAQGLFKA